MEALTIRNQWEFDIQGIFLNLVCDQLNNYKCGVG